MKLDRLLIGVSLCAIVLTIAVWVVLHSGETTSQNVKSSPPPMPKRAIRTPPPTLLEDVTETSPIASNTEQAILSAEDGDQRLRTQFIEGLQDIPDVPDAALESYLQQRSRNAASLLVAWRVSGDSDYLKEAATQFPNNPRVQFAVLTCDAFFDGHGMLDAFFNDRSKWVELFKQSSPNNALANYFAAQECFRQHQTEKAVAEMTASLNKQGFEDYLAATIQDQEYQQLFLSAGSSSDEAQVKGFMAACWTGAQYLRAMRDLGGELARSEAEYTAAGDSTSAQNLARLGIALAQQMRLGNGRTYINQDAIISIEETVLKKLPPDETLDRLGQTPAARLAELAEQRELIKSEAGSFLAAANQSSQAELVEFDNRAQQTGDMVAAMQWLSARKQHP